MILHSSQAETRAALQVKPSSILALMAICGALVFQLLFYREKMALNFCFYAAFIMFALCWSYRSIKPPASFWWVATSHLVTLVGLVVHHTDLAQLAAVLTLVLCAVQWVFPHKNLYYAARTAMGKAFNAVPLFLTAFFSVGKTIPKRFAQLVRLRIYIVPLAIAGVFFVMYALANRIFSDVAEKVLSRFGNLLEQMFTWIAPERLVLLLLGLFFSALLLLNRPMFRAFQKDVLAIDELVRKRGRPIWAGYWAGLQALLFGRRASGTMALKLEYKLGIASFVLLNGLLLVLNLTDVVYVWFNHSYKPGFEWVAFVHEGAWMLVFSILVAMLVVLFFFRGNLNFLANNKWLKQLTMLWLAQNLILCISVGIRNFYYIQHMGLAYKRIGLMFYLFLVVVGLVSVAIKVLRLKSLHYLVKVNGWVVYGLLVLATLVNWDVAIVRYNLQHSKSVPLDVEFLLTMHPATIPILEAHAAEISSLSAPLGRYQAVPNANWVAQYLQQKKADFLAEQVGKTWLSWNLPDWRLIQQLQSTK